MGCVDRVHGGYVFRRRIQRLCRQLVDLIPRDAQVLDVGCGDGQLDGLLLHARPDVTVTGIDVLVRPVTQVPVQMFDGRVIPYPDDSFTTVMLIDTLHHTEDPRALLQEAARVARESILIKDHTRNGLWAAETLRFMDWVGNKRFGVALPHTYWSRQTWLETLRVERLQVRVWRSRLRLYPWPASCLFDRSLHFIALLGVEGRNRPTNNG